MSHWTTSFHFYYSYYYCSITFLIGYLTFLRFCAEQCEPENKRANWETRPRTVTIYCFVSFKRHFTRQIWEREYTEPPKREEWLPLPWLFFVLLTIRIRSFFGGVFFFCIPRQDQWDRRAGRSARFFFSSLFFSFRVGLATWMESPAAKWMEFSPPPRAFRMGEIGLISLLFFNLHTGKLERKLDKADLRVSFFAPLPHTPPTINTHTRARTGPEQLQLSSGKEE